MSIVRDHFASLYSPDVGTSRASRFAKEANALAEALRQELDAKSQVEARRQLTRLKAKMAQVVTPDFFGANGREAVDGLLIGLEAKLTEVPWRRHLRVALRIPLLAWRT